MTTGRGLLAGLLILDVVDPFGPKMLTRFGGIAHAARMAYALGLDCSCAFVAPAWAQQHGVGYLKQLNANPICLGTLDGAPGVILSDDPNETAGNRYELLLRELAHCSLSAEALGGLGGQRFAFQLDIGGMDDSAWISQVPRLSPIRALDIDSDDLLDISLRGGDVDIFFTSTSQRLFLDLCKGAPEDLFTALLAIDTVILKEGRGGSRCRDAERLTEAPAILLPNGHSIGVGDAFDVAYLAVRDHLDTDVSLRFASVAASLYASTVDLGNLKLSVDALLGLSEQSLAQISGVRVPWEQRPNLSFYLAAPDFDYVDVGEIDRLQAALTYHNFGTIRPVKQFGQLDLSSTEATRLDIFEKDRSALDGSTGLIAVALSNDPGTLLELGYAARSKPTAVYDPYRIANNLWLAFLPDKVSSQVDEIVTWAFQVASQA